MSDRQPGLVDALLEIGKERQQILADLRTAYQKKDLESVLKNVSKIVGLDEELEGPDEKSH